MKATIRSAGKAVNGVARSNLRAACQPRPLREVMQRHQVLGGLIGQEFSHLQGLLQPTAAYVGLVEQIFHDFQHHCGIVRIQLRGLGACIRRCAEDDGLEQLEGIRINADQGAHIIELVKHAQLAGFAPGPGMRPVRCAGTWRQRRCRCRLKSRPAIHETTARSAPADA